MLPIAFIQNLNGPEIFLIFLVVLLLFGAKRLPELSRSFGKSIKEFKKATSGIEHDIRTAMDEEPAQENKRDASESTEASETEKPASETDNEKKASS